MPYAPRRHVRSRHACRPPHAAPTDPVTPPADLKWKLRCLRRRAGYGPERPWQDDVLRHSYATYYLLAGGELPRLMLNMGHSNTRPPPPAAHPLFIISLQPPLPCENAPSRKANHFFKHNLREGNI